MENPPFWWYENQENMGIFMGHVSFREGTMVEMNLTHLITYVLVNPTTTLTGWIAPTHTLAHISPFSRICFAENHITVPGDLFIPVEALTDVGNINHP